MHHEGPRPRILAPRAPASFRTPIKKGMSSRPRPGDVQQHTPETHPSSSPSSPGEGISGVSGGAYAPAREDRTLAGSTNSTPYARGSGELMEFLHQPTRARDQMKTEPRGPFTYSTLGKSSGSSRGRGPLDDHGKPRPWQGVKWASKGRQNSGKTAVKQQGRGPEPWQGSKEATKGLGKRYGS